MKLFDEAGQPFRNRPLEGPFILIHGTVVVWERKADQGDPSLGIELGPGCIFGEKRFRIGKEEFQNYFARAARCVDHCIIAVLNKKTIDTAFTSHRGVIDPKVKCVFSQIRLLQNDIDRETIDEIRDALPDPEGEQLAVPKALHFLANRGSHVEIAPGQVLMADEPHRFLLMFDSRSEWTQFHQKGWA